MTNEREEELQKICFLGARGSTERSRSQVCVPAICLSALNVHLRSLLPVLLPTQSPLLHIDPHVPLALTSSTSSVSYQEQLTGVF